MQIKQLEKRVEFQSGLDVSHQLALQKARNPEFIRDEIGLSVGSDQEKCFMGRGTSCGTFTRAFNLPPEPGEERTPGAPPASTPTETFAFTQGNNYGAKSDIFVGVTCGATACQRVDIAVMTDQTSGGSVTETWKGRKLRAQFSMPASALAGRQEIDFGDCAGRLITGINYATLKAECVTTPSTNTCNGMTNTGPMNTFGQPSADPANCQPPVNASCPNGMASAGLINGQVQCAPAMTCSDPMSPGCATPVPPPCTANYQPTPANVCLGQAFTQIDANNCPGSAPIAATGTNSLICPVNPPCTLSGPVRWPNPSTGPCGVPAAALSANGGTSGSIQNENLGYLGTLTIQCIDNSPAANTFDMASASAMCEPIVCPGVGSTLEWSSAGVKSAVAGPGLDTVGPYLCSGPQTIAQATSRPAGELMAVQAEPGARATSANTDPRAASGTATMTCSDPGPVTAPRSGVRSIGAFSCTPAGGPADPPVIPPPPTATPAACFADGYATGAWSGSDDAFCTAQSSFGPGLSPEPYAQCCSGMHGPTYGAADTIGGGRCYWLCGGGGPPPPPPPTPAPTAIPESAYCPPRIPGRNRVARGVLADPMGEGFILSSPTLSKLCYCMSTNPNEGTQCPFGAVSNRNRRDGADIDYYFFYTPLIPW